MSLPTFTKNNIQNTKGLQPSKFDVLLEHFQKPGDCIEFDEKKNKDDDVDGITRAYAAVIARRFREITDKPFHSFFNARTGKVTIRLRLPTELTNDDSPDDESDTEESKGSGIGELTFTDPDDD